MARLSRMVKSGLTIRHLYVLDDAGEPRPAKDFIEWAQFFETGKRQVALNEIGDMRVSTVFMGIAVNPLSDHPILFESMVFDAEHHGLRTLRARSRKVALEQHQTLVEECRKKLQ